jgi:hypothetical protein
VQAYTSTVPQTLLTNPQQLPGNLSKFEYKTHESNSLDLKIFCPPNASVPTVELTGLTYLPFGLPLPNTTVFGPLFAQFLATTNTARDPSTGSITSKIAKTTYSILSTLKVGAFTSITSPSGELSAFFKGILPVGLGYTGGLFAVDPPVLQGS